MGDKKTHLGYEVLLSPVSAKLLSQLGKIISGGCSYTENLCVRTTGCKHEDMFCLVILASCLHAF